MNKIGLSQPLFRRGWSFLIFVLGLQVQKVKEREKLYVIFEGKTGGKDAWTWGWTTALRKEHWPIAFFVVHRTIKKTKKT